MATTMTNALGGNVDDSNIHTITCEVASRRRAARGRRNLLSAGVQIGFSTTLAAATFFDDDTGDDITAIFEANLMSVVSTGELSSNIATAATSAAVQRDDDSVSAMASVSVDVAASIAAVATVTANEGTVNFEVSKDDVSQQEFAS